MYGHTVINCLLHNLIVWLFQLWDTLILQMWFEKQIWFSCCLNIALDISVGKDDSQIIYTWVFFTLWKLEKFKSLSRLLSKQIPNREQGKHGPCSFSKLLKGLALFRRRQPVTLASKQQNATCCKLLCMYSYVIVFTALINSLILVTNLHMPLLAHGINDTPLYGSPTGTTDWYTHLVMAGQTVELSLQFPGFSC